MTCTIDVLAMLFSLATSVVAEPAIPNQPKSLITTTLEYRFPACTVNWFDNSLVLIGPATLTESERLRCWAEKLEREEVEARQKLADYTWFKKLAAQCASQEKSGER